MPNPNFIYVSKPKNPEDTIIGGTFCGDESEMLRYYETLTPDQRIGVTGLKKLAAETGENPVTLAMKQDHPHLRDVYLARCLNRIASGGCLVYPPGEH